MTEDVTLEHAQLVALAADVIIAIIEEDQGAIVQVMARMKGVQYPGLLAAMGAIAAATLLGQDYRAVLTEYVENIVKEV